MSPMKWLKHIILMVSLMFAAMPCTHADEHHHASGSPDAPAEISAVHCCACHSCDADTVCTEPYEMPQDSSFTATVAAAPVSSFQLFVLNPSKPVSRQVSPPVTGPFVHLMTVQLLI